MHFSILIFALLAGFSLVSSSPYHANQKDDPVILKQHECARIDKMTIQMPSEELSVTIVFGLIHGFPAEHAGQFEPQAWEECHDAEKEKVKLKFLQYLRNENFRLRILRDEALSPV
jgi:hypothetical protein